MKKDRAEALEDLVSQELDKAELETKIAKAMAAALNGEKATQRRKRKQGNELKGN